LGRDDLLLLKNYRDRRDGRLLGYKEILSRGLSCVGTARDLDRHQVDCLENTPDELLGAGLDMADGLAGRATMDAANQRRFRSIGAAFQSEFKTWPLERRFPDSPLVTCYGYGLPWVRHADSYFKAHPGFLDD
jgi:hypothetical protein